MKHENANEGAKEVWSDVLKCQVKVHGPLYHKTLQTTCELADVYRDLGNSEEEAEAMEKKLIDAGRYILRNTQVNPIDSYLPLRLLANFVYEREHMMVPGIMFLVKAWVIYKDKLGQEHELSNLTKLQLTNMVEKEKLLAVKHLEMAELYDDIDKMKSAEHMFRQAWAMSSLQSSVAHVSPGMGHELSPVI
eukprot:gene28709-31877_t